MKNNKFTEFMKAAKYYSEPTTEEKIRIAMEKRAAEQSERRAIIEKAPATPTQSERETEPEYDYESEHIGSEVRAAKKGKNYYRRLYS